MTWCVGTITKKEAMLYVDARATVGKQYNNILLKLYPIGPGIVAAFAGSIKIGFELIKDLKIALELRPEMDPQKHYWKAPLTIIRRWAKGRKKGDVGNPEQIFKAAAMNERKVKSQLLIVGITPTPDGFYKPFMVTIKLQLLQEPDIFITEKPNTISEIGGCGGEKSRTYLKEIEKNLEQIKNAPDPFASLPNFPRVPGQILIDSLSMFSIKSQDIGVSPDYAFVIIPHMKNICVQHVLAPGTEMIPLERKWPLCKSYEEFKLKCKELKVTCAGAQC